MSVTTRPTQALPPTDAFDRDYWLAHCEGFRVDAAEGRLGFVDEVRAGEEPGSVVLAVRAGALGRRLVLVPGEGVDFIVPRAQRIWLHAPTRIIHTGPVERPGA